MIFRVNTSSSVLGGNIVREQLIIDAADRHDAARQAEHACAQQGRPVVWSVLPIRADAIALRMERERLARASA